MKAPESKAGRKAVIDIGTNSIKLLVADLQAGHLTPVRETSEQTRLGENFFQTRTLQPGPIARTAAAVSSFARQARELGCTSIRVIATSAVRDAVNRQDLLSAIELATGLPVDVITGAHEAEWAFRGATTSPILASAPLLLLDLGGGSMEMILGYGSHVDFKHSFDLGTVRLMEKYPPSDPPLPSELETCRAWVKTFLQEKVRPQIKPDLLAESRFHPDRKLELVATGGTATILGRIELQIDSYDRVRIENLVLSRNRLGQLVESLWSLPLSDRQRIKGLPKDRADIILTGALILYEVAAELRFSAIRISTRGLRFGAIVAD